MGFLVETDIRGLFFWEELLIFEAGQWQDRLRRDLGHTNSIQNTVFLVLRIYLDVKVGCTHFFSIYLLFIDSCSISQFIAGEMD